MYGGFSGYGSTSHDIFGWLRDVRDWFGYAFSWVLDDVSANFWQIGGDHISPVKVISGDAYLLVWIYNIVLAALILTTLWRALRDAIAFRWNRWGNQDYRI